MARSNIKPAETPAERRAYVKEAIGELTEIIEDVFYVALLLRAAGHSALAAGAAGIGEGAMGLLNHMRKPS